MICYYFVVHIILVQSSAYFRYVVYVSPWALREREREREKNITLRLVLLIKKLKRERERESVVENND